MASEGPVTPELPVFTQSSLPDNLWHQLWAAAEPATAQEQPPVIDPDSHGEAVVGWFEGLNGVELAELLFVPALQASCASLLSKEAWSFVRRCGSC